jgi:hypothetical protein
VVYEGQTFPFGKLILIAEIKNFCGVASFKSSRLSDTRPAKFSDSSGTHFHLYCFFSNNFTLDCNKLSFIVHLSLTESFAGRYLTFSPTHHSRSLNHYSDCEDVFS